MAKVTFAIDKSITNNEYNDNSVRLFFTLVNPRDHDD